MIKVSINTLRRIIREEVSRRKRLLGEVNHEKLVVMFKAAAALVKALNPQSGPDEIAAAQDAVQNIGQFDMAAGERLQTFFQKKMKGAEGAWGHVGDRSTAAEQPGLSGRRAS